jgi:hypothetical protein
MADKPTDTRSSYFTQERINGDLNYHRAQLIAKHLLDAGLISTDEFHKLTVINRRTFSPLFAEIMPKTLDV